MKLGRIADSGLLGLFYHHLKLDEREFTHSRHIIGLPGTGKSKLMESLWLQAFERGYGTLIIDPHGPFAEAALTGLVSRRFFDQSGAFQKVTYVEFENGEWFFP